MSTDQRYEELVKELLELAETQPLSREQVERVREIMIELKKMGHSNEEIFTLAKGRWSLSTIKANTKGAKAEDSSVRDRTAKLLVELIRKNRTIDDLEKVTKVLQVLDAKDVGVEDVAHLLEQVKKLGIGIDDIVRAHMAFKESGVPVNKLSELLKYKTELENIGFRIEDLSRIKNLSDRYGGFDNVYEALQAFAEIKELRAEIKRLSLQLENLKNQLEAGKKDISRLEEEKAKIKESLMLFKSLEDIGFNLEMLEKLSIITKKFGGMPVVFNALDAFKELDEIELKRQELNNLIAQRQAQLKGLEADYAHLQNVTGMCRYLLAHNFTTSAIEDIYSVAKAYGEPYEAMKAVEEYGELTKIQKQVDSLLSKKTELEQEVSKLQIELNSKFEMLDEMSKKISTLFSQYEDYSKKLGEKMAEGGRFEEELNVARLVKPAIDYPSESEKIPFNFVILLQNTVLRICEAKKLNDRRLTSKEVLGTTSGLYIGDKGIALRDLLTFAERGLESVQRGNPP